METQLVVNLLEQGKFEEAVVAAARVKKGRLRVAVVTLVQQGKRLLAALLALASCMGDLIEYAFGRLDQIEHCQVCSVWLCTIA